MFWEVGARSHAARHAMMCAERRRARNVAWQGIPGPFWGAVEAGEEAVEG